MKKELLIISLLLLLSFPAVAALLAPGGFTSHDLTHHVIRQISMHKLLSEGQFPPRWSGELNNGYGYPVFLFNYPLPAMLGEIFHKLGMGYVDSVKAVLLSSMILSVLGMYLFLKALLNDKLAAFLGAVFYLYAPLRFLNVYVSAAVGSALGLGLVPFIFWSMLRGKILPGSIFFAALILSHNVTALIFAPVLLVFSVICSKPRNLVIMFLLGLGLSAWFWIPAVFEKQYTLFDQLYSGFYKDQFPTLWQLLRSPWGYGLSHPQNPEPGDMSYQLGLIHILAILVFSIWYVVYGRKSNAKRLGLLIILGFFISVFMMLKISLPFWETLPFLSLIQFPLRFSAVAIFCASIAAALLVKYLPYKKLLFISLLLLVIYANRNHWNINEKFDPGEDYYLNLKTTSASFNEHLPKWGRVMDEGSPGKLEFVRGVGEIKVVRDKSNEVLADVSASSPATLRFNQFYFPGWEIKIDGKKINFDYKTAGENYGLPVFDIDVGSRKILAEFKNTPVRNLADTISIISVILWGIMLCKLLIRK